MGRLASFWRHADVLEIAVNVVELFLSFCCRVDYATPSSLAPLTHSLTYSLPTYFKYPALVVCCKPYITIRVEELHRVPVVSGNFSVLVVFPPLVSHLLTLSLTHSVPTVSTESAYSVPRESL